MTTKFFTSFGALLCLVNLVHSKGAQYIYKYDGPNSKSYVSEENVQLSFRDAQSYCATSGGVVWMPDADEDINWIAEKVVGKEKVVWAGLISNPPGQVRAAEYNYLDGRFGDQLSSDWLIRGNCSDNNQCCALTANLVDSSSKEFLFFPTSCTKSKRNVICQKKVRTESFTDVAKFEKSYFAPNLDTNFFFVEAINRCAQLGATIWLPNSAKEQEYVGRTFFASSNSNPIWLALVSFVELMPTNIPKPNYFWTFDARRMDFQYTAPWHLNDPKCTGSCCAVRFERNDKTLSETHCNDEAQLICEKPLEASNGAEKRHLTTEERFQNLSDRIDGIEAKIEQQNNRSMKRDAEIENQIKNLAKLINSKQINIKTFNESRSGSGKKCSPFGKCYFRSLVGRTFAEARTYCSKSGGQLPELKTRDEQIWFAETYQDNDDAWLAIERVRESEFEFTYRYLDGTHVNSGDTNWKRSANGCGSTCCGVMAHYPYGQWVSEPCDGKSHVTLCEEI